VAEPANKLHRSSDRRLLAKLVPNFRIESATWSALRIPTAVFSVFKPEPLLFLRNSSAIVLTRLSGRRKQLYVSLIILAFLTLALDGVELASCSGCSIHCIGSFVGPRAGLDVMQKRKRSCHYRKYRMFQKELYNFKSLYKFIRRTCTVV
jgi:hypothetical protein